MITSIAIAVGASSGRPAACIANSKPRTYAPYYYEKGYFMYFRIASIFTLAVATAGFTAGLAGAASASLRVPPPPHSIYSVEQAGYAVTGNTFRFVSETFVVPDAADFASELGGFGLSDQLWSSTKVVTFGLSNSTVAGNFCPAVSVVGVPLPHTLLADSNTTGVPNDFLCSFAPGETVTMSVYRRPGGTDVFNITNGIVSQSATYADPVSRNGGGSEYTQARVSAEFGCTPFAGCTAGPVPYNAPPTSTLLIRINGAAFTSTNGVRGDLTSSHWATQPVTWTRNGGSDGAVNVSVASVTDSGHDFNIFLRP